MRSCGTPPNIVSQEIIRLGRELDRPEAAHQILDPGLLANGGPSPTRRVLVESRGRRCTSASARPVSGLLSLSGLEHSQLYRVYDYYAHHSSAVDSSPGSTMGWELPAQQLPTSRHGITAGRPHRTEAPSSCQPPATLTTRRYSGLSPNRTNTRTSEPGSSCARVGRNTSMSGGTCRTRKHLQLSVTSALPPVDTPPGACHKQTPGPCVRWPLASPDCACGEFFKASSGYPHQTTDVHALKLPRVDSLVNGHRRHVQYRGNLANRKRIRLVIRARCNVSRGSGTYVPVSRYTAHPRPFSCLGHGSPPAILRE